MRLSFEDEANEEIACGREYTRVPAPWKGWLKKIADNVKLLAHAQKGERVEVKCV